MKINHILTFTLLSGLISCSTISYTGETYKPSDKIDVYYKEKDVAHPYKTVGRIITIARNKDNKAKEKIIEKAKSVGADAVIFSGVYFTEEKTASAYEKADVIKYTD
ncbi:hypothetical protein NZD88_19970 [Chryseobacterium antibioticum]|uniref:YdgH/BhsA/McbA-like domain-containing protein n=1 Tax=Chryseobacterium pyrolae TaxID=2987481 RepID=A0ABT2IMF7_9FLAO|nr:hypothetical protein [Chryseobacterium pyrolae]MCT2409836.1 hypothetical protein [Chryseobacterium pyrolae]